MKTRHHRRLLTGALLCTLAATFAANVIAPVLAGAGTPGASVAAFGARPTLAQLEADIASSVQLSAGPNIKTSIPPLLSMTPVDMSIVPMDPACYSDSVKSVPSNFATRCAWGSKTATRTIFLFGDSQAAQWVPALNALGVDLGWKIIMLGLSQCSPWVDPQKVYYTGTSLAACDEIPQRGVQGHQQDASRHRDSRWLGARLRKGKLRDASQFLGELQTMATALKPSGAKLVFLSPIPGFYPDFTNETPSTCLTAHAGNIGTVSTARPRWSPTSCSPDSRRSRHRPTGPWPT